MFIPQRKPWAPHQPGHLNSGGQFCNQRQGGIDVPSVWKVDDHHLTLVTQKSPDNGDAKQLESQVFLEQSYRFRENSRSNTFPPSLCAVTARLEDHIPCFSPTCPCMAEQRRYNGTKSEPKSGCGSGAISPQGIQRHSDLGLLVGGISWGA